MLGEAVDPCLQSWYRWLSWLFVRGVGVFFGVGCVACLGCGGRGMGICMHRLFGLSGYFGFLLTWRRTSDDLAVATHQDFTTSRVSTFTI